MLPSRNCCYAKCSHLVVKHSCGFPPSLSVSPPLHRGSSLGLWCNSCLVRVFSASSLQSLPHAHRGLLGRIIHILSTLHTQYCFRWQGQPASQSISQPSLSVCVHWMGLAFAWLYPSCSTLNERPPHIHTLDICFARSHAAPYIHSDYTVCRCVCVCGCVCMFVVGAEQKNKVLIKSNRVNLSMVVINCPQLALSSPANGGSAICYVDRYTHT